LQKLQEKLNGIFGKGGGSKGGGGTGSGPSAGGSAGGLMVVGVVVWVGYNAQ